MRIAGVKISLRLAAAVVLLAAAAFWAGLSMRESGESPVPPVAAEAAELWTCSMHPQIRLPEPGQCPICFMDLVRADDGAQAPDGTPVLELTPEAVALAEIETAPVSRRFVERGIRLSGTVAMDRGRVRELTAWFPGRIETLYVSETGVEVEDGDRLATIYSPRLYAAQVELRAALATAASGGSDLMRRTARATAAAARERLLRWGLSPAAVDSLAAASEPTDRIDIVAPAGGVVLASPVVEGMEIEVGRTLFEVADLDRVWIELDAYARDLPWLRQGQAVELRTGLSAGEAVEGVVALVDPVLDPVRRTATVRIEADNEKGLLRPGLPIYGTVLASLDAGGVPAAEGTRPPLVIPATAPLLTGKRAVVYVRDPASETPRFSGREVVLGPRADDHFLVVSGLAEGELVAVGGAFKIDSEMQIRARPSMMSASGEGAGAAKHAAHGGGLTDGKAPAAERSVFPATAGFTAELDAVVSAYFSLQTSLAGDDPAAAAAAARELEAALAATDAADMPAPAASAWNEDRDHLRGAAAAVASGSGLAEMREPLDAVSDRLWGALLRYEYRGPLTVRRFHCPMAGEGGADWLQSGEATANPYYGAAMFRCGGQTDTIPAAGSER